MEQRFYDFVALELQSRNIRPGLWARAVAEVGDEGATARARYIQLRVKELADEERLREHSRKQETVRQASAGGLADGLSCGRCVHFLLSEAHNLWRGHCNSHRKLTYSNCSCDEFKAR